MENKERILKCAEELFYAKGYETAGVQEIAERAGLTKPTLYYYFGNKRGLLETILDTKFSEMQDAIRKVEGEPGDIQTRLYRLADAYYAFFTEERTFYRLLMALFYSAPQSESYQVVRPYLLDFYEMIVGFFEQASGELGNMNGRQRQFAISFLGMIHQYLMLGYEEGQADITREQMHALVHQYMHGIFS